MIGRREERLLGFLEEPRTLDEMVAFRIVYRPGAEVLWADHVEHLSIGMHLRRLVRNGVVAEVEPGRWRRA